MEEGRKLYGNLGVADLPPITAGILRANCQMGTQYKVEKTGRSSYHVSRDTGAKEERVVVLEVAKPEEAQCTCNYQRDVLCEPRRQPREHEQPQTGVGVVDGSATHAGDGGENEGVEEPTETCARGVWGYQIQQRLRVGDAGRAEEYPRVEDWGSGKEDTRAGQRGEEHQRVGNGGEEQPRVGRGGQEQRVGRGGQEQRVGRGGQEQRVGHGGQEQRVGHGGQEQRVGHGGQEQPRSGQGGEQPRSGQGGEQPRSGQGEEQPGAGQGGEEQQGAGQGGEEYQGAGGEGEE
ncbi:unnamed protein product [Closterium sp. NIES-65]|nr:unnamed protein product [Closterium sp. NIES-65]